MAYWDHGKGEKEEILAILLPVLYQISLLLPHTNSSLKKIINVYFEFFFLFIGFAFLAHTSSLWFYLQIFLICCLLWTYYLPQMLHFMSQTLVWSPYSLLFSTLVSSGSSLIVSLILAKEKKKKNLDSASPCPTCTPTLSHSPSFHLQLCWIRSLQSAPEVFSSISTLDLVVCRTLGISSLSEISLFSISGDFSFARILFSLDF